MSWYSVSLSRMMSGSVTVADSSLLLLDWGRLDCLKEEEVKGIWLYPHQNKWWADVRNSDRGGEDEVQNGDCLLVFQQRVIGFSSYILQSLKEGREKIKNINRFTVDMKFFSKGAFWNPSVFVTIEDKQCSKERAHLRKLNNTVMHCSWHRSVN